MKDKISFTYEDIIKPLNLEKHSTKLKGGREIRTCYLVEISDLNVDFIEKQAELHQKAADYLKDVAKYMKENNITLNKREKSDILYELKQNLENLLLE